MNDRIDRLLKKINAGIETAIICTEEPKTKKRLEKILFEDLDELYNLIKKAK